MLIFIDESGDTGFKFNKGSSNYFVIVAVIFDDYAQAQVMENVLKKFKEDKGFRDDEELKSNKSNKRLKLDFMTVISKYSFKVHAFIINKRKIDNNVLAHKDNFYVHAIKMLLKNSRHLISNAVIKLDGSGDKIFKKAFISTIKKQINAKDARIIKDLKFSDSKGNLLIQMADMIAGAIRKACDGDRSAKVIIKKHIEVESYFP